jgi:hypothetical protein
MPVPRRREMLAVTSARRRPAVSAPSASPTLHDAYDPRPPGRLARVVGAAAPGPPREADWLRVAVWTAALVISCAVWGGIGLAVAAVAG